MFAGTRKHQQTKCLKASEHENVFICVRNRIINKTKPFFSLSFMEWCGGVPLFLLFKHRRRVRPWLYIYIPATTATKFYAALFFRSKPLSEKVSSCTHNTPPLSTALNVYKYLTSNLYQRLHIFAIHSWQIQMIMTMIIQQRFRPVTVNSPLRSSNTSLKNHNVESL